VNCLNCELLSAGFTARGLDAGADDATELVVFIQQISQAFRPQQFATNNDL
jgi:hypothetical protein